MIEIMRKWKKAVIFGEIICTKLAYISKFVDVGVDITDFEWHGVEDSVELGISLEDERLSERLRDRQTQGQDECVGIVPLRGEQSIRFFWHLQS